MLCYLQALFTEQLLLQPLPDGHVQVSTAEAPAQSRSDPSQDVQADFAFRSQSKPKHGQPETFQMAIQHLLASSHVHELELTFAHGRWVS